MCYEVCFVFNSIEKILRMSNFDKYTCHRINQHFYHYWQIDDLEMDAIGTSESVNLSCLLLVCMGGFLVHRTSVSSNHGMEFIISLLVSFPTRNAKKYHEWNVCNSKLRQQLWLLSSFSTRLFQIFSAFALSVSTFYWKGSIYLVFQGSPTLTSKCSHHAKHFLINQMF